jgi:hypothetical protein
MASRRHHSQAVIVLIVTLTLGIGPVARAVEFAGGTGDPNDPYQIATAEQLVAIGSDPGLLDRHFVLVSDIDLDPHLPGGKVFRQAVVIWSPASGLASQTVAFEGCFNGDGHVIRNCVLQTTGEAPYGGFFRQIGPQGIVRELRLENIVVSALSGYLGRTLYCGVLTPVNQGLVIGCSATGRFEAQEGGGLIDRNSGVVVGCHARCNISGGHIGGLIRLNLSFGRVVLCGADGTVSGDQEAGGLVASNDGLIQYCTAGGSVSGASVGGLVGWNHGVIRDSYATSTVSANRAASGLARGNAGTIVNCYATGSISGASVDGLVCSPNVGILLACYSTTPSSARGPTGTSLGPFDFGRDVRFVYYLDPNKPEGGTDNPVSGYGVALSPPQMKQVSSFAGFDFYGDPNDGPVAHWFMPTEGYPVLTWQTEVTGLLGVPDVSYLNPEQAELVLEAAGFEPSTTRYDYAGLRTVQLGPALQEVDTKDQVIATDPVGSLPPGSPVGLVVSLGTYNFTDNAGDGSEAKPYQIETAGQLDSLYGQTIAAGRHYVLTADIDLSAYTYAGPVIPRFSGEFDGNGHTIRGLQIVLRAAYESGFGLFGSVESDGSVHDLVVDQASLLAVQHSAIGILAGWQRGQILRCRAVGQILGGHSEVGGLVGYNIGQLTECRFSGRIRPAEVGAVVGGLAGSNLRDMVRCCAVGVDIVGGDYCVGGLAGSSVGLMTDCSFRGRIRTPDSAEYVGGLVGRNTGAIARCCAPAIDVAGGSYVGGLAGESGLAGIVESCYATGAVEGVSHVGGLAGNNGIAPSNRRSSPVQGTITAFAAPTVVGVIRRCYAACSVTGREYVGGAVGSALVPDAVQESCFFLASTDGGGLDNGFGTPLTAVQMSLQDSFAGWDFENTWTICEGRDYPRLRWEQVECGE